ncbi:MAG TPA: hypothetical protein VF698_10475, partial [Thermoanaerobaculia bacterium]
MMIPVLLALTLSLSSEAPLTPTVFHHPAPGQQYSAAVATNGRDFLAAWTDARSGNPDIYATRIAADGRVLDPNAIVLPS